MYIMHVCKMSVGNKGSNHSVSVCEVEYFLLLQTEINNQESRYCDWQLVLPMKSDPRTSCGKTTINGTTSFTNYTHGYKEK